jgi:hypothetical protein
MSFDRVSSLRFCILPLKNKNRLVGIFLPRFDCTVNGKLMTELKGDAAVDLPHLLCLKNSAIISVR